MKKSFLLLFVAFMTLTFCAKAQVPFFSENFDSGLPAEWVVLDSDGDTYTWESSLTTTSYFQEGTDISGTGHNGSNGHMLSGSYSNVYGALTPDNWLITPSISLAGESTLTFWLCAQDASYAAEHYGVYVSTTAGTTPADFTLIYEETIDAQGGSRAQGTWKQKSVDLSAYAGQTIRIAFRHFNCSDQFILNLDDVEISAVPTDPTIIASESVTFGTLHLGDEATQQINVSSYALTTGITVTTTAPFAVSADNSTFGTTATLAQAGGTLYIKYTPTAAGDDEGTVVLSSTGATDVTITVTGSAIDCNGITFPYSPDFSSELGCWTSRSDGEYESGWFLCSEAEIEGQVYSMSATGSWFLSDIDHDNWLISPSMTMPASENLEIAWKVKPYTTDYSGDHYGVYVITDNTPTLLFEETLSEDMTNFVQRIVAIPETITGDFQVAFRHFNSTGGYVVILDDIQIRALSAPVIDLVGPTAIETGNAATFVANCSNADSFAWTVDGTAVTETTNTLTQTFTTLGNHTIAVTATNTVGSTTDSIITEVYTCANGIESVPYLLDFESGLRCWTMVSIDSTNDGNFGVFMDANAYEGNHEFVFSSYSQASDYNQYLISPELNLPATSDYTLTFQYKGRNANEAFKVLSSTTTNSIDAFTNVLGDYPSGVPTEWTEFSFRLPAGTKYVAINYYGNYQYYGFVDNIAIEGLAAPTVTLEGPDTIAAGTTATYTATSPLAETFTWTVDGTAVTETSNVLSYAFTTAGPHTVVVTATNNEGSSSDTIITVVIACETISEFPYTQGFESSLDVCWQVISMNTANEGILGVYQDADAFEGSYDFRFSSFSSATDYNQYLITPELELPSNMQLSFQYKGYTTTDPFRVMVSSTTNDISAFTEVADYPTVATTWTEGTVMLPANTKYIAINYYGNFRYYLYIDNLTIDALSAPAVTLDGPTSARVGNNVTYTATSTTAETFAWKVDGADVTGTENTLSYTFTTTGDHTVEVTATNAAGSATASLTVNVFDCEAITTLPYTQDFENLAELDCWTFIDNDGDGYNWDATYFSETTDDYGHDSHGFIASASYINQIGALTPDNWMILPAVTLPSAPTYKLNWFSKGLDANDNAEYYEVYVSTNGQSISDFTTPAFSNTTSADWEEHSVDLSSYAGQTIYIAFRHYNTTNMYWLLIDDLSIAEGTGINENDNNVSLYPNPANNVLNVNANSNINSVEVFNMMGQRVAVIDANDTNVQINTTDLSNGMYMMRINTENGVSNQKFTVAR